MKGNSEFGTEQQEMELLARNLPHEEKELQMPLPEIQDHYCQKCTSMVSPKGLNEAQSLLGFTHHTPSVLHDSAVRGCTFCTFIVDHMWLYLENYKRTDWPLRAFTYSKQKSRREVHGIPVFTRLIIRHPLVSEYSIVCPVVTVEDGPLSRDFPNRFIEADFASKEVTNIARRWMSECRDNHTVCQPYVGANHIWPSRLIDVDPPGDKACVLVPSSKVDKREEYMALSYCWGGPQRIVATTENINLLEKVIEVEKLELTIQDAIEITRRLGVRYLWVDALCILQNCDTDKKHEIPRMGSIYKNSAATIFAASTLKASEGFLRAPHDPLQSFRFELTLEDCGKATLGLLSTKSLHVSHPLDKRGWALQEWLLSPRRLVFSNRELLWSCQTQRSPNGYFVAESGLRYEMQGQPFPRMPRSFLAASKDDVVADDRRQEPEMLSKSERNEYYAAWTRVVENYSWRQLTVPEDKLHALAGISNEFKLALRDRYLAGVWREAIPGILAWYRSPESPGNAVSSRPDLKRSSLAPSWSWASLDCPISYAKVRTHEDARHDPDVTISYDTNNNPLSFCLEARLCKLKALKESGSAMDLWYMWDTGETEDERTELMQVFGSEFTPMGCVILFRLTERTYERVGYASITGDTRRVFLKICENLRITLV